MVSIEWNEEVSQTVTMMLKLWKQSSQTPTAWVTKMIEYLNFVGVELPSSELVELLVSLLWSENERDHRPSIWKFLYHALTSQLIFPLQLLSLLSSKVFPHRHSHPHAYTLFLQLLREHVFNFQYSMPSLSCKNKIIKSVDSVLHLSETFKVHDLDLGHICVLFFFNTISSLIDITLSDAGNAIKTSEVLEGLCECRNSTVFLQAVLLNMPENFNCLLQKLQSLESLQPSLANPINKKVLSKIRGVSLIDYSLNKDQMVGMIINSGSPKTLSRCNYKSCWVAFDVYMEDAMDCRQIPISSAIEVLKEKIKALQRFNAASWHETFLAVWLSALRLVQRERDPAEGPIPQLEPRLSMLLAIVPLAIVNALRDHSEPESSTVPVSMASGSMKLGLISAVQFVGEFSGLLCPPALVVEAANHAATKAASFISTSANANTKADLIAGNLWHLIVECCIARNLMDTSAYFWPGYVSTSAMSSLPQGKSPWSTFMEGAPLIYSLKHALMETPASSLAEIEKLCYIALNGPEVLRPAAARILCGASLSRGWSIQELVVQHAVKLLTSSVSHGLLVDSMSMISAVLHEVSCMKTLNIISLHGLIPTLAASLLPVCEVFGSITPTPNRKGSDNASTPVYRAFSLAFILLIRLGKLCRPLLDQCTTEGRFVVGGGLEYLLSLHNKSIMSSQDSVYIDSFPKLRDLYCLYKSCVASTISGIPTRNSTHQTTILSMVYKKVTTSEISGEERLVLPAWEILEALPFVLEAMFLACAYGSLSSQDLTKGLRHLVIVFPASLTAIMDYFSSEVTRGAWKLVPMNGEDWPSTTENLQSLESEIKTILTHAGVELELPSCSSGGSPAMLPLPMAVLATLSITFTTDKSLEYIRAALGAALENCATGCHWPVMPIVCSLWMRRANHWNGIISLCAATSVFRHNNGAISKLVRSCFTSFLGILTGSTSECSVNGLLGSSITDPNTFPYVAPGYLLLRCWRDIHSVKHLKLNDAIVGLITEYSHELAGRRGNFGSSPLKFNEASIPLATQSAKEMATLGASLLCAAGGFQQVQELYNETIPAWILSSRSVSRNNDTIVSCILEGYAIAYLLTLSGSLLWGIGTKIPSSTLSRRNRIIRVHLDFLAVVMEKQAAVSCDPVTWKTYVCCVVGLMVSFAPSWLHEVRVDTLRTLARGLSSWNEIELAISLLLRGGTAAMGALIELLSAL